MGAPLASADDRRPRVTAPPTYLEIVGPPGAGKTTLTLELKRRHPQIHVQPPPDYRELRNLPFFVRNILSLAPEFAAMIFGRRGRWLNSKEFFWTILLNGWHRRLRRQGSGEGLVLFDQGPFYYMFGLLAYRKEQLTGPLLGRWWKRISEKWSHILRGVIWLDTSDDILTRRIDGRCQDHLIKGASASRTRDFLEGSRVDLSQVLAALRTDRGTPAVISFDTGRQSLEEIADALSRELKLEEQHHSGRPLPHESAGPSRA